MKKMLFAFILTIWACAVAFGQQGIIFPGKLMYMTDSLTLPIGKQNGIVITSDPNLNKVFRNNQVYNYFQSYPASRYPFILALYTIECNCNESLLKDTLQAAPFYTYVEFIMQPVFLSSGPDEESSGLKVFPVPFAEKLSFDFKGQIEKIEIFDLTGRQVYKNENPPNSLALKTLKPGQYILFLTSKTKTYRRMIWKE